MSAPAARFPRRRTRWAALLALAVGAVAVAGVATSEAADPAPDFAFFREKVEPVLQSVCAQCHAGAGKGQFALVARARGASATEAESRRDFETVRKLLVPGKPNQSKFLMKPLAKKDGGTPHQGGDRIFKGTAAYTAWVDFIEGAKGKPTKASAAAPAPSAAPAAGQPDFGYFAAHVEPVLLGVCAQCHAAPGRGALSIVVHAPGARVPLADHRRNYETVLKLVTPGKPTLSKLLMKPLAKRDGGMPHEGGDRIAKGDASYRAWVDFINGVKGPPPPEDPPPQEELPTADEKGVCLQAEDGDVRGDASTASVEGAKGKAVVPGAGGGRVVLRFRASRRADYAIALRSGPGARGARVRVDGGEFLDVPPGKDGFADVMPAVALDGGRALEGRSGRLTVDGGALAMDGREGVARFLSPADLPHTKVAAVVVVPAGDEPGRDDAWLLFDCIDWKNGKFFGLADAGRQLVMGVIEAGRPRIVKAAPAPVVGGETPVALGVDLADGIAVGRVDGKPTMFVNFDKGLGAGKFGFQTHGTAVVREMVAHRGGEEVHRVALSTGAVFPLTRGDHTLEVDLVPQGAAVDSVTVKEATR